jgi:N-methylhydantoinase A
MANENMANAIRLVTVDRGLDHRTFDLLAFGGAGPLHAGELADGLGMRRVLVPLHPGLTSAFGVMSAAPRVDRRWTRALVSSTASADDLRDAFARLVDDARDEIRREGYDGEVQVVRSVTMRYLGQNYEQEIAVPPGEIGAGTIGDLVERFHAQHESFYAYAMRDNVCELAQLNVTVQGSVSIPSFALRSGSEAAEPASLRAVYFAGEGWVETPIYLRDGLGAGSTVEGPAVVEELDSTTVVHPGHRLSVDAHGVMALELAGDRAPTVAALESWR